MAGEGKRWLESFDPRKVCFVAAKPCIEMISSSPWEECLGKDPPPSRLNNRPPSRARCTLENEHRKSLLDKLKSLLTRWLVQLEPDVWAHLAGSRSVHFSCLVALHPPARTCWGCIYIYIYITVSCGHSVRGNTVRGLSFTTNIALRTIVFRRVGKSSRGRKKGRKDYRLKWKINKFRSMIDLVRWNFQRFLHNASFKRFSTRFDRDFFEEEKKIKWYSFVSSPLLSFFCLFARRIERLIWSNNRFSQNLIYSQHAFLILFKKLILPLDYSNSSIKVWIYFYNKIKLNTSLMQAHCLKNFFFSCINRK